MVRSDWKRGRHVWFSPSAIPGGWERKTIHLLVFQEREDLGSRSKFLGIMYKSHIPVIWQCKEI